jgi:hypothetical protein
MVEPNPELSKGLQERFNEVYRDLYGQLAPAHHRLRVADEKSPP